MNIFLKTILFSLLIIAFFGIGAGQVYSDEYIDIERDASEPSACCKLKHNFRTPDPNDRDMQKGEVIGAIGTTSCIPGTPNYNLQEGQHCCPFGYPNYTTPFWAGVCTLDAIKTVSDWVFWIAFIVVGIALVVAGIMFAVAGGSTTRVTLAKQIFGWSLLGVLVAALAKFIPGLVRYFFGI